MLNFIFPILRHTVVSTVFICDAITNLIYLAIMVILWVTFWSKTFSAYLRSLVLGPLPLCGSDDVLVNGLFDATIFLIRTPSGRKSLVLSCGSREGSPSGWSRQGRGRLLGSHGQHTSPHFLRFIQTKPPDPGTVKSTFRVGPPTSINLPR